MTADDPPRDGGLPPGYDEEDPYEGVDLSIYPDWWRRNAAEFRDHGMRPYRPPRFVDGQVTTERIESLETDLGVEIRFRAKNPQDGGRWHLVVDGLAVAPIDRERSGDGFSVYDIESDEFERLVRNAVRE